MRGGRPVIAGDIRALIRQMSIDNPLWGAPRIHGELLKLGFEMAQSMVAKYMVKRWGPPSQGWRTFLRNHASESAAMDLFVVPTVGFSLLYAFVIVRLDRRALVWIKSDCDRREIRLKLARHSGCIEGHRPDNIAGGADCARRARYCRPRLRAGDWHCYAGHV